MINRRSLITGLVSLVAAPAIVRAGSLMPVKALLFEEPEFNIIVLHPTLYEALTDITRRAFVPRRFIQVRDSFPLLDMEPRRPSSK